MVSADSCAYVEDYAAPVFKQNASCRAVYEYAKEHLPQYSKVLLAMRWGSQMPENSHSLAYDADFFKKFDLMLQKLSSEKQSVYLMIDNPNLSYNGLRAYILSYRIPGFSQNLAIDETVTSKGNERIKELAEKICQCAHYRCHCLYSGELQNQRIAGFIPIETTSTLTEAENWPSVF